MSLYRWLCLEASSGDLGLVGFISSRIRLFSSSSWRFLFLHIWLGDREGWELASMPRYSSSLRSSSLFPWALVRFLWITFKRLLLIKPHTQRIDTRRHCRNDTETCFGIYQWYCADGWIHDANYCSDICFFVVFYVFGRTTSSREEFCVWCYTRVGCGWDSVQFDITGTKE